jgi:FkbM family methyltransferase
MRSLNVEAPAPIALFAYRRPEHLRRTLEALRANPEAPRTELHIFCDGPRDGSVEGVEAVRELALGCSGFAATRVICRDSNYGLARNITEGVSGVLKLQNTVIVIEDDIVVSPFFLRFMNDALRLYRDEPRVGSISGYCYPVSMPVPETYFILGADCWGWATWRDRWQLYNPDGKALLAELEARNLERAFDFDGAAGLVAMLKGQIAGKNDSWAIRWHASCFLRDLLVLYPGRPLAQNIGHDGSGTHSSVADDSLNVHLSSTPISLEKIAAKESREGRAAVCDFFFQKSVAPTPAHASDQALPIDACDPASISRRPFWRRVVRRALPEFLIRRIWQLRQLICAPSRLAVCDTSPSITSEGDDHVAASYWGLHELDRQIEKYLDFDNGYFVELGANDGHFQSNTLYYEQSRGWRGILIEPAPVLCQRCRENRSRANHVVNAACVSFTYPAETVELIYSNAMSVSLHVETDLVDPAAHAELGRQFLRSDETLFNFRAPARTLNSVLVEANAPRRIDFLSLDVEGAEIEVLKGINHEAFRFRYMLIECRDIDRLRSYLKTERYRLVEKFNEHDYFFASEG